MEILVTIGPGVLGCCGSNFRPFQWLALPSSNYSLSLSCNVRWSFRSPCGPARTVHFRKCPNSQPYL